jgi:hypothetical protein
MKPRVLPFAAICLVSPPAISFARDLWCEDGTHSCPHALFGWTLHLASSPFIPSTRLALRWRGEGLKPGAYLDVYFRAERPSVGLAADPDGGSDPPPGEPGGVPDDSLLATASEPRPSALSPRVVPNPGGASGYLISFVVSASGPVELEIYNVAGQRVATLVSAPQEAGRQRLRWRARTSRGHPIGTGVYFVRLKTSQGVQATKFVHLGR